MKPRRHLDFIALMEALGQPGCPACRLAARAERRFLETLFYEQVTDPELRGQLRRSSGFCEKHTGMVLRLGDALGCSIIYADLLDEAAKTLRGGNTDHCPACRMGADAVVRATSTLVSHVSEDDVQTAYRTSDGLCLRHLGELTDRNAVGARALEAIERERLRHLAEECREFVAKSDYQQIGKTMGAERNAWQRAARKLGGGVPENGTH